MILEIAYILVVVILYLLSLYTELYVYSVIILIVAVIGILIYDYIVKTKIELRKRFFLLDEYKHYSHIDFDEYISNMENDITYCDICNKCYWKNCAKRCKC